MSLSIDYITMPPKSQEVSQIQHGEQVKYDQANQQMASQFQQMVRQGSEQAVRREKAENKEFRYEEKDRNGKGKKGKHQKKGDGNGKEEQEQDTPLAQRRFDMKI